MYTDTTRALVRTFAEEIAKGKKVYLALHICQEMADAIEFFNGDRPRVITTCDGMGTRTYLSE